MAEDDAIRVKFSNYAPMFFNSVNNKCQNFPATPCHFCCCIEVIEFKPRPVKTIDAINQNLQGILGVFCFLVTLLCQLLQTQPFVSQVFQRLQQPTFPIFAGMNSVSKHHCGVSCLIDVKQAPC